VVESAPAEGLFAAPTHPYTNGLLRCVPVPGLVKRGDPLGSIPGTVPRIAPGYTGCAFRERCDHADASCATQVATQHNGPEHAYRCRLTADWAHA
jgi:peptide/nickel transport system ATP-binding protein